MKCAKPRTEGRHKEGTRAGQAVKVAKGVLLYYHTYCDVMVSEARRPKRRATQRHRSTQLPSAAHYVGYVEDDESPEMIMRKFEALERVKQAALDKKSEAMAEKKAEGNSNGEEKDTLAASKMMEETTSLAGKGSEEQGGYDESLLLEVFKETSYFNVKALKASNENMGEEDFEDEDLNASDYDIDDDEFWNTGRKGGRKRGSSGGFRRSGSGMSNNVSRTVTVLNRETGVYIQRKVRVVDEALPQLLRVPNAPVPLSWARTVTPYRKRTLAPKPEDVDCSVLHEKSIAEMNFDSLRKKQVYLGILINKPSWTIPDSRERLQALQKIPVKKLCPTGFIFIWIDKRDVERVCDWMYDNDYVYVENLTWVYMLSNNKMVHDQSRYLRTSHLTLYMFRKYNQGKDIELRHQRNPDVVLDCMQSTAEGGYSTIPKEAYKAIETLLPGGHDRLLELWAAPQNVRKGWTQVIEGKD
jgi:hypothetical protein